MLMIGAVDDQQEIRQVKQESDFSLLLTFILTIPNVIAAKLLIGLGHSRQSLVQFFISFVDL